MSLWLKQSTQVAALIGPFLDKTDGVTEEVGLAGADTEISKNHAAFGAGPVLGTHDSDGWYPITLTTTHTNTLGPLIVKVHDAATHLPVWVTFMVLPANIYDSLVSGTDLVDVSVTQWLGTAAATPTVAGVPEVDLTHVAGATTNVSTLATTVATNLDAAMTTRATPAQVNTEVLDVLNVDTFAEPGQATPAATTTLSGKLGYLYKAWRNRTAATATQYSLYNDDATTVDQKATLADDGTTASRTEIATGP